MTTVAKYFGKMKREGLFGIEMEIEGRYLPIPEEISDEWRMEHDGSLRGEENAEYVLVEPLGLRDSLSAVRSLLSSLYKKGSEVDNSRSTSTHVHVNCTDMEMRELANFVTTLLMMEGLLVNWCDESRHGNLFCMQSKDAYGNIRTISEAFRLGNFHNLGDNVRYSAVNFASLIKYGSIELRCLQGTTDLKIISLWLKALNAIREFSLKQDTPKDIIMNSSLLEGDLFVREVLGEKLSQEFYIGDNRRELLFGGIRLAQDVAFAYSESAFERGDEFLREHPKY